MKIISGKYKGITLKLPKNIDFRPTTSMVREGVKNVIYSNYSDLLVDNNVLELFCGSGIMSMELISNGAKHATCIDCNTDILTKNIPNVFLDYITSYQYDLKYKNIFLEHKYSIVYIDPPYKDIEILNSLLSRIPGFNFLADEAILFIELDVKNKLKIVIPSYFENIETRRYGKSCIFILKYSKKNLDDFSTND